MLAWHRAGDVHATACFMGQSPNQVGGRITSGRWDCAVVNCGHVLANTDRYIKV